MKVTLYWNTGLTPYSNRYYYPSRHLQILNGLTTKATFTDIKGFERGAFYQGQKQVLIVVECTGTYIPLYDYMYVKDDVERPVYYFVLSQQNMPFYNKNGILDKSKVIVQLTIELDNVQTFPEFVDTDGIRGQLARFYSPYTGHVDNTHKKRLPIAPEIKGQLTQRKDCFLSEYFADPTYYLVGLFQTARGTLLVRSKTGFAADKIYLDDDAEFNNTLSGVGLFFSLATRISNLTDGAGYDCKCIGLWALPAYMIYPKTSGDTWLFESPIAVFNPLYVHVIESADEVHQSLQTTFAEFNLKTPNTNYCELGTGGHVIKWDNTSQTRYIKLDIYMPINAPIKIILEFCGVQVDITDDFALTIISSAESGYSAQEKTATAIQLVGGLLQTGISAFSGNAAGAAFGLYNVGATVANTIAGNNKKSSPAGGVPNGGFYSTLANSQTCIFVSQYTPANVNEITNEINERGYILEDKPIVTSLSIIIRGDSYYQFDNVDYVRGGNVEAMEDIRQRLLQGVHFVRAL